METKGPAVSAVYNSSTTAVFSGGGGGGGRIKR